MIALAAEVTCGPKGLATSGPKGLAIAAMSRRDGVFFSRARFPLVSGACAAISRPRLLMRRPFLSWLANDHSFARAQLLGPLDGACVIFSFISASALSLR